MKIAGLPIAYWATNEMRNIFLNKQVMRDFATPRQGLSTGNNDQFLRLWHEISLKDIKFNCSSKKDAQLSQKKWFPCHKGGEFRRWFGNNRFVINWKYDGSSIKRSSGSVIRNESFYFNEGTTRSTIGTISLGMRYSPSGFLFENKGSMCIPLEGKSWQIALALMNSNSVNSIRSFL